MSAAIQQLDVALPTLPESFSAENGFKAVGKLAQGNPRPLEPVGMSLCGENAPAVAWSDR